MAIKAGEAVALSAGLLIGLVILFGGPYLIVNHKADPNENADGRGRGRGRTSKSRKQPKKRKTKSKR